MRSRSRRLVAAALLVVPFASPSPARHAALPRVVFNDNHVPAGTVAGNVRTVSLVIQPGEWRPYGADSTGVPLLVFGETGKAPQDPGPLLRVRLGTRLHVRVRNASTQRVVVHGLSARRVDVMDTLVLAPGATGEADFTTDAAGTFYYWASAHGEGFGNRVLDDAHLNGALIVDPAGTALKPDRVFVVEWFTPDTLKDGTPNFDQMLLTINGRPWPYTERLTYDVGDSVRWRIINANADVHPFHMHGFFYRVDARGDVQRDTLYWPAQQRHVVTEVMWSGSTMDMAWSPDRPGGWIFHCHFNFHVTPNAALPPDSEPSPLREQHLLNGYPGMSADDHAMTGMGGLVLGLYIRPPAGWHPYTGARRTLRLLVASDSAPGDSIRRYSYRLDDGSGAPPASGSRAVGPAIILHRGEPTRIVIVNHTAEMTQVHWHGLEIESSFDGVAGVSGIPGAMEPAIMPGDSYAVYVTPPRAGSYIYHTHINDIHQQSHGLYGPLVVLDSGMTWTPDSDRIFIVGDGPDLAPVLNDGSTSHTVELRTGVPYRFRLINITVADPDLRFQLVRDGGLQRWTPVAKDAWPTPPWQRNAVEARQAVSIGETYDFQVQQADTGMVALELRRLSGQLVTRQLMHFGK